MKTRSVIFKIFVLFLCAGKASAGEIETRIITLNSSNPEHEAVRITNAGKTSSEFSFRLNNGFLFDSEDLVQTIHSLENAYPHEPLERKAWRFVCDHMTYNFPLMENYWQRNPLIMLNGLGFDKCGNQAEMLAAVWNKLGFKTRIWSLQGHIVPEVFAGNKWQMFDPSFAVYYQNQSGSVFGAEELMNDPGSITDPLNPVFHENLHNEVLLDLVRYSDIIANIYSSKENNREYAAGFLADSLSYNFTLLLPPAAAFEFPMLSKPEFVPVFSFLESNYANGRLSLPSKWAGKIDLPLLVCAISGTGNVKVNGKDFKIGSKELNAYLASFSEFNYQLDFDGNQEHVEVIYILNGAFAQLGKVNKLQISGTGVKYLKAEIFQLPPSQCLENVSNQAFKKSLQELSAFYKVNKSELDILLSQEIATGWEIAARKTELFVDYLNSKSPQEKLSKKIVLEKISAIAMNAPPKISKQFFRMLENPLSVVIFTSFLSSCSPDEITFLMNNIAGKKKQD